MRGLIVLALVLQGGVARASADALCGGEASLLDMYEAASGVPPEEVGWLILDDDGSAREIAVSSGATVFRVTDDDFVSQGVCVGDAHDGGVTYARAEPVLDSASVYGVEGVVGVPADCGADPEAPTGFAAFGLVDGDRVIVAAVAGPSLSAVAFYDPAVGGPVGSVAYLEPGFTSTSHAYSVRCERGVRCELFVDGSATPTLTIAYAALPSAGTLGPELKPLGSAFLAFHSESAVVEWTRIAGVTCVTVADAQAALDEAASVAFANLPPVAATKVTRKLDQAAVKLDQADRAFAEGKDCKGARKVEQAREKTLDGFHKAADTRLCPGHPQCTTALNRAQALHGVRAAHGVVEALRVAACADQAACDACDGPTLPLCGTEADGDCPAPEEVDPGCDDDLPLVETSKSATPDEFGPGQSFSVTVNVFGDTVCRNAPAPTAVVFAIDTSGSMESLLPTVKDAAAYVAELIMENPENLVGLVWFAFGAFVSYSLADCEAAGYSDCLDTFLNDALPSLAAGGPTDTFAGMDVAVGELLTPAAAGHKKLVLLLTDGVPYPFDLSPCPNLDQYAAMEELALDTAAPEDIVVYPIQFVDPDCLDFPDPCYCPVEVDAALRNVALYTSGLFFDPITECAAGACPGGGDICLRIEDPAYATPQWQCMYERLAMRLDVENLQIIETLMDGAPETTIAYLPDGPGATPALGTVVLPADLPADFVDAVEVSEDDFAATGTLEIPQLDVLRDGEAFTFSFQATSTECLGPLSPASSVDLCVDSGGAIPGVCDAPPPLAVVLWESGLDDLFSDVIDNEVVTCLRQPGLCCATTFDHINLRVTIECLNPGWTDPVGDLDLFAMPSEHFRFAEQEGCESDCDECLSTSPPEILAADPVVDGTAPAPLYFEYLRWQLAELGPQQKACAVFGVVPAGPCAGGQRVLHSVVWHGNANPILNTSHVRYSIETGTSCDAQMQILGAALTPGAGYPPPGVECPEVPDLPAGFVGMRPDVLTRRAPDDFVAVPLVPSCGRLPGLCDEEAPETLIDVAGVAPAVVPYCPLSTTPIRECWSPLECAGTSCCDVLPATEECADPPPDQCIPDFRAADFDDLCLGAAGGTAPVSCQESLVDPSTFCCDVQWDSVGAEFFVDCPEGICSCPADPATGCRECMIDGDPFTCCAQELCEHCSEELCVRESSIHLCP